MNDAPEKPDDEIIDDPPPFLGTWGRVYAAVIIYLAVLITCFYIFKIVFTP